MTDDLFLSRPEIRVLSTRLRELRDWVCADLDDTVCRQVAFNDRQTGRTEEPLYFNENASTVSHDLRDVLRTWTEHVCTHATRRCPWPGEQRAYQYAAWLDRHLIDLAKTAEAQTAADELEDAWKRAKRAIDRPMPQEFVGPCQSDDAARIEKGEKVIDPTTCEGVYCRRGATTKQCRTCNITIDIATVKAATEEEMRGRLFTKSELRDAMAIHKTPISRQRLDNWIRRGRLIGHGGKYKLDDALALAAEKKTA